MRRLRFAAVLALLSFAPVFAASYDLTPASAQAFLADNAKKPGVVVRPSGLQYRVLRGGFGRRVAPGDVVQVQLSGSLINGAVVDGSSPGLPATLAVGNVIRGLSEALQLMHVGDHWQLAWSNWIARRVFSAAAPRIALTSSCRAAISTASP